MSDGKAFGKMAAADSGGDLYSSFMQRLGMTRQNGARGKYGVSFHGDGAKSRGEFWYYGYKDWFYISVCDFTALQDLPMHMPAMRYLVLRLGKSGHRAEGRLTSFLEEKGSQGHAILRAGRHISYVEILYLPAYYEGFVPSLYEEGGGFQDPAAIMKSLHISGNWPSGILQLLRGLAQEKDSPSATALTCIAKGHELMALLLQAGKRGSAVRDADLPGMAEVISHIGSHLGAPITQKELVHVSKMSATKLKSTFKAFTGKTITEYVSRKRMEKAEELLAETENSVDAVAQLTGFCTPTGFSTAFRKYSGLSPRAFRRRMAFQCTENPTDGLQDREDPRELPDW